ncbi:hypothetical protein DR950_20195 [Kitasatospora xanthocidica]|uniref:Uncharacterized protein n=1 Tax=Kitasatospora xanthocidica TaxID=83382 RepID=A0A372ZV74_9ACTN|nr:hypothetical protein DR950_20195 [Kitasatospora xanthocidica]
MDGREVHGPDEDETEQQLGQVADEQHDGGPGGGGPDDGGADGGGCGTHGGSGGASGGASTGGERSRVGPGRVRPGRGAGWHGRAPFCRLSDDCICRWTAYVVRLVPWKGAGAYGPGRVISPAGSGTGSPAG